MLFLDSLWHIHFICLQSVELTDKTTDFLKRIFAAYDLDGVSTPHVNVGVFCCSTVCA